MAKKTTAPAPNTQVSDVMAFFFALVYMHSVLTVAHHTSMWIHNGTTHTVEAPAVAALVIGVLAAAYSFSKRRSFSTLVVIALTVLATASLFWLSGLRTNFYF